MIPLLDYKEPNNRGWKIYRDKRKLCYLQFFMLHIKKKKNLSLFSKEGLKHCSKYPRVGDSV